MKIIKRIFAAVTILVTAIFMSIPVLADTWGKGTNDGSVSSASYGSYPFGYASLNNLSWRVDLFVSSAEDGKIDPSKDTVIMGQYKDVSTDKLSFVGSVLFTNVSFDDSLVYLQADYTTSKRDSVLSTSRSIMTGPNTRTVVYNFPSAREISSSTKTVTDVETGITTYIKTGTLNGLPENIESLNDFQSQVQAVIEQDDFMYNTINTLAEQLTPYGLATKVMNCLSPSIANKVYEEVSKAAGTEDSYACLYPYSSDCVVSWAAVVTPLMQWKTYTGYDYSMWFNDSESYQQGLTDQPEVLGANNKKSNITLILDAYESALYNKTTQDEWLYYQDGITLALEDADITIPFNRLAAYEDMGVMRREFSNKYFENIGSGAIVAQDQDPYCGIRVGTDITDWSDANMAQYGGITITLSDEPTATDTPPLYYHIYYYPDDILPEGFDPDDPDFDLLKDIPEPTPTVTVSPTKVTDPYNPSSDPNMPGYPVAIQAPKPDGTDPSPQTAYPNLPSDKCLMNVPPSDPLQPLVGNTSVPLGTSTPDDPDDDPKQIDVKVIVFGDPTTTPTSTVVSSETDHIKTNDVTQYIVARTSKQKTAT